MRKITWLLAIFSLGIIAATQSTAASAAETKTKNVIMVIGDGMGPAQMGMLLSYARQAPSTVIKGRTTAFDRMMKNGAVMGMSMTNAANGIVGDSAASATQLATGKWSGTGMIGVDKDGNRAETIAEIAQKLGKSTGLVSDTRLTHATPASFAAHQRARSMENEIAVDLVNSGTDVMLSGGLRYFIPKEANKKDSAIHKELKEMTAGAVRIASRRKDSRNLLKDAQKNGYALAFNKAQLEQANGKVLGLFAYTNMKDAIRVDNSKNDPKRTSPTLKEMSAKAIDILSKNDKGFFLMIEAGQIDWASHFNDAGTMLHEMLQLNETLNYVLDWAEDRNDTLIIVTADHEAGGFSFSYSGVGLPAESKVLNGDVFKGKEHIPTFNFGNPETLEKLYNQKLSYVGIFFGKFRMMDDQTPAALAKLINANTEFPITEDQAKRILEKTENYPYYLEGHSYFGKQVVPKVAFHTPFYYLLRRLSILGNEVANSQGVVWSNGTHTATPVIVLASGPAEAQAPFRGILHITQVGQYAINALMNK